MSCSKVKTRFLYVQPRSVQARDRFESLMDKLHSCRIEREVDDRVLLSSISGRYSFWINKEFDSHWEVLK